MTQRAPHLTLTLLLTSLAACGYVGGPQPPLVNIPRPVTNLAAVQRGDKLIVQFSVPTRTTENEPLKPPVTLDLRIGERHVEPVKVDGGIARYEIPAADWVGKDALIQVRVFGANGKESSWTNLTAPVVSPPEMPRDVKAESAVAGVRLTWASAAGHFHVLRAGEGKDAAYLLIAPDVQAHEYADTAAEFGKPYKYLVQGFVPLAGGREAQSDLPDPVTITPEPPLPTAPTGLRAVPGTASVELSWDVPVGTPPTGYRIYRATGAADFVKIGDTGAIPTFSDRSIEAGKTYRYAVAALDAGGREGPRSNPLEITP